MVNNLNSAGQGLTIRDRLHAFYANHAISLILRRNTFYLYNNLWFGS